MGCGASLLKSSKHQPRRERANTEWKLMSTHEDVVKTVPTGELSKDEIELLVVLSEPVGQRCIGSFAKDVHTLESFLCWVEIQEYKAVPSMSFRRCLATNIFKKYVRPQGNMALGGMTEDVIRTTASGLKAAEEDSNLMSDQFFRVVERMCLKDMALNTFALMKKSSKYQEYKKALRSKYNQVVVDDFDYIDVLGTGGFGRVVHAVKKSTGFHYAMKIQLKTGLLSEHDGDLSRMAGEKVIFQACNYPYIVDMHYSFQTEKYAIIVLDLVRGGDLRELLRKHSGGLRQDSVILFAAEMALALNHLHEMGLLYRDLKPANVLLTEKGHINLADMGLASGLALNDAKKLQEQAEEITHKEEELYQRRKTAVLPINLDNSKNYVVEDYTPEKYRHAPKAIYLRRKTTVGTKGYMAPEMLLGKLKRRSERKGYNHSVDYWALGVTVFELLCGFKPFEEPQKVKEDFFEDLQMQLPGIRNVRQEVENEVARMKQEIEYPKHLSSSAKSFISRLLDPNPNTRLGCSEKGFIEIMTHPFFKTIQWDELVAHNVQSTLSPNVKPISTKPKYSSFTDMMTKLDMRDRDAKYNWALAPDPEEQVHFESWDYISQLTIKAEMGIANDIDESNIPFKVMQITGESGKSNKSTRNLQA